MNVYVEDWGATYGSPYLVQPDDQGSAEAVLVEDGSELRSHTGRAPRSGDGAVAFVDGVRRGEASLWLDDPATDVGARGVAGGHACGCVLAEEATRPEYGESRVIRLAIFGSGLRAALPDVPGGWRWQSASVDDTRAEAPLEDLQERMRIAEAELSETLCRDGYLTVVDGPLYYVRSRDLPVVGYVKTHQKAKLSPKHHRKIPELDAGERTSLFRLGDDRYSAYLRLTARSATSSPWAGIVRIEVPQSAGLAAAIDAADRITGVLPRFAGVPHRDPRAPQNLQPIGALETYLRHLLGHPGLASRAVREAVATLVGASV